jgi:hypothetical protein
MSPNLFPIEFREAAPASIPAEGLRDTALREAVTEYRAIISAVCKALEQAICTGAPDAPSWVDMEAIYPDSVIAEVSGKYWQYPYTLADDGTVTLGAAKQVVEEYVPVADVAANARLESEGDSAMIEALAAEGQAAGTVWRVWVIRSGLSKNNIDYPGTVLREAAPMFDGTRVFEKSDEEHLQGKGKDSRNLIGQLLNAVFVEATATEAGGIQADLHVLECSGWPVKLVEMQKRKMLGLVGFSIDASGSAKQKGAFREAVSITKVKSLDLIVEPGAGGRIINLIEAEGAADMALRDRMIAAIKTKNGGSLPANLNVADDDALDTAYREAVAGNADVTLTGASQGEFQAVQKRLDAIDMREALAGSGLPEKIKQRLIAKIDAGTTKDTLDLLITNFKEGLGDLTAAGFVTGLGGSRFEGGEDRSDKIKTMLDDFFDPNKPTMSFRECYMEITGDRGCTGLLQNCDKTKLREAAGADFREAVSASTFADILGDSIARRMIAEYQNLEAYLDWRWLVDIVPIRDFRTNERTRMGGYGNLPAVAENGSYSALTTPGDEKETYAISKRGGTETVSLETTANDDVGVIRRIPLKMANSAARTLFEFVYDFLVSNPTMGDGTALFHASRGNLGSTALSANAFAAARLAIKQRTELSSNKRLGIILKHLIVPSELEETAFDLFVRGTNLDQTFVQSRKPTVHVVDYWSDTNNWVATADKMDVPLIELGFFNGQEQPEIFVQDTPNQGSLFSNDQIKYKIRHIYGGNVLDHHGMFKAVVA